jgi:hypothetical protein
MVEREEYEEALKVVGTEAQIAGADMGDQAEQSLYAEIEQAHQTVIAYEQERRAKNGIGN